MTVMLTPELKPFFGGTYFPPHSKWGRPGFMDLLNEIARVWKHDRAARRLRRRGALRPAEGGDRRGRASAWRVGRRASRGAGGGASSSTRRRSIGATAASVIRRSSRVPPNCCSCCANTRAPDRRAAADVGGDAARDGDGRDARSRRRRVSPLLGRRRVARAALREDALRPGAAGARVPRGGAGLRATICSPPWRKTRWPTCSRDLRDPAGGFYSAEDADSTPFDFAQGRPIEGGPKKEGAFYVWSDAEIASLLGADADIVRRRFGIEPGGNAPNDPHGEFTGQNILYTAASIEEIAAATGRPADDVVGRARPRAADPVRRAREAAAPAPRRQGPHLVERHDDRRLRARGARAAGPAAGRGVARRGPRRRRDSSESRCASRTGRCCAAGVTATRRSTPMPRTTPRSSGACSNCSRPTATRPGSPGRASCRRSRTRASGMRRSGGWFSTTGRDPSVLLRLKEDYDGAEPSASSVSVLNLLTLAHLVDDDGARQKAERTLARYGENAGRAARVIPMMLAGLSTWHAGAMQVVVVGSDGTHDRAQARARAALPAVRRHGARHPGPRAAGARGGAAVRRRHATGRRRGTAFVCRDFACREPVTTTEALAAQLLVSPKPPGGGGRLRAGRVQRRSHARRVPPLSSEGEHRHRGDDRGVDPGARFTDRQPAPEAA